MPRHPLTTLRFKIAKTTILLPVTAKSNLSTLRETLLAALSASSNDSASPELEFSQLVDETNGLPLSSEDIALWRLEPSTSGGGGENWIRLTDDKSTADKLGLSEAEEVGVSFKTRDGKFPLPNVIRPRDDFEEEGMEEEA